MKGREGKGREEKAIETKKDRAKGPSDDDDDDDNARSLISSRAHIAIEVMTEVNKGAQSMIAKDDTRRYKDIINFSRETVNKRF